MLVFRENLLGVRRIKKVGNHWSRPMIFKLRWQSPIAGHEIFVNDDLVDSKVYVSKKKKHFTFFLAILMVKYSSP